MNQYNFGPPTRPLTPREKSIRFKFGLGFVFASLCAVTLGVLYSRKDLELKETQAILSQLDSVSVKLDYMQYKIDDEGDSTEVSMTEKINLLADDASRYREMHDDLFELRSNDARYEMALEYYADPLMHQEYRDRTGTSFKSKYTESQRKEIVAKIRKETESFNSIIAYRDAFDWYREIDPAAIKEIELFLYFTE